MKKLRLFHDRKGNTLTVWFDEPKKETISEELGGDFIVMKDRQGNITGFEKLNYIVSGSRQKLPIEVISA